MKVISKGLIDKSVLATKSLYTGSTLKRSTYGDIENLPILEKGQTVDVVGIDEAQGTVTIIHPIDPERVLVIAADAVRLYNEATGLFNTIKAFLSKVGGFFKSLFGKKG